MKDGKSVLTRARREAKEISARGKLATPLVGGTGKKQIVKPPQGMVNEYRKAADPGLRIFSRRKKVGTFDQDGGAGVGVGGPGLEERERRLRAAMGGGIGTENLVGSSDEESMNEGDNEGDDLFDEPSRPARPGPAAASSSRPLPKDVARSRPPLSSPPNKASGSSPPPRSNRSSPAPGAKPMMPRKRPPVDVFNRGAKKPRPLR